MRSTTSLQKKNQTYIYALADPLDHRIYYVGKTNNLQFRLGTHIRQRSNLFRKKWVTSLVSRGLLPYIIVLEEVEEIIWQEREIFWIALGKKLGWPLTNIQNGG